ncbi:MAG TPA: hypothetical protein VE197_03550 [Mycobacterium sp.]|nr:hypothetical protein [Mycobacterium sp.]
MQTGDARTRQMFAHGRPVVECADCGARLYVPEWSEVTDRGRIRYLWQCESCGCSFQTTTRFEAA